MADLQSALREAEERVKMLRVLVFDHASGRCLVNQLLDNYTQPQTLTTPWTHPVRIPKSAKSFDFYFVANETSASYNLSTALLNVTNRSDLYRRPTLNRIPWQPEFLPKLTGGADEELIPMTAVYLDVDLDEAVRQGMLGQGTEQDPYRFLSKSGQLNKVRLTRSLARIDIKIPEVILNATLGDPTSDEILALSYIDDLEMTLVNVPRYFSLFASLYYDPTQWTESVYAPISSNYYTNPQDGQSCYYIEDNIDKIRRNMLPTEDPKPGAIGELNLTDYYTTIYVPEYIRPKSADTGLTNDQINAMKVRLTFQVNAFDPAHRPSGRYLVYNYPVKDDIAPRTSIETGVLTRGATEVSDNSVIRNTHYQITIRELDPTHP